jgi:MIP family channel proteins
VAGTSARRTLVSVAPAELTSQLRPESQAAFVPLSTALPPSPNDRSNMAINDKQDDAYVNLEAHDGLSTDDGSLNDVAAAPYTVNNHFTRQLMAEFFATFIGLSFGLACQAQVTLSSGAAGSFVTIALAWGFAYFLAITVGGGLSGGTMNPTVVLALALIKRMPWKKVPFFILVQLVASYIAALVVYVLYRPLLNAVDPERATTNAIFATYPLAGVGNFTCFLTEAFAAALLVVGFLALIDQHNRPIGQYAVAPAIGVLVSAIAMGFGVNTGLAINATRDLGPRLLMLTVGFGSRVFSLNHYYFWIPLVAPIVGAVVGGVAYIGLVSLHHPGRAHGPYPEFHY